MIQVRLLRNATLVLEINGKKILVDPMLAPKDTYDPIIWTSNNIRNPMVELPVNKEELDAIIAGADAVLITHTHNDHWDVTAQQIIPSGKLLLGQPEDEAKFRQQGFTNITSIQHTLDWEGIQITRTGAQHGTGEIGAKMAPVSGFVLNDGKESVYLAGDTIWCSDVEDAIDTYQPDMIVLNAGAAQFDMGDPIIMTEADVLLVCKKSKANKIVCVHIEAINHCYLKRPELKQAIAEAGESARCIVPADGETVSL
ncbi:MAG: MBL fold metallo-hydrolase [Chitinophagaceae bacterium]